MGIKGIHHITALAGDPQANIDFYVGVLGLRLVKVSVNQDDPSVYHFFYADEIGSPGTDLTFFPYPGVPRGVLGYGVSTGVYFAIPFDSLDYWVDRLKSMGVMIERVDRSSEGVILKFSDWDGLSLALVASKDVEDRKVVPWRAVVPPEHFIRGFYKAEILVSSCKHSGRFLEELLGFRRVYEGLHRVRYEAGGGGPGSIIDVLCPPDLDYGVVGVGTIHHIAWEIPTVEEQVEYRRRLLEQGYRVTSVIDRKWFKSIYFREPGGVLYEIATSGPGFTVDEPVDKLGSDLVLPEWLEPQRNWIESVLPRVKLPTGIEIPRRRTATHH